MVGPNFFIIGAAKSGTTSLSSLLDTHPQTAIVPNKEPHFFSHDQRYQTGWSRYVSLYRHCSSKTAIGDASTSYSRVRYHPAVPDRIKRHVPDAKIIYMVRHPVERMVSAYIEHLCSHGSEVFMSINDAVRRQPMILDSSRYWEVFEVYRQRFDEARIRIVWFEDYIRDQTAVFQDVCRFLGVDDTVTPDFTRENRNSRLDAAGRLSRLGRADVEFNAAWDDETRKWVVGQIREETCRFLDYFNRPRSYWPDCL